MFVFDEVGQAIGPRNSIAEAIAGVVSETVYLPFSAYLTSWLLRMKCDDAASRASYEPRQGDAIAVPLQRSLPTLTFKEILPRRK
jgi:hypothetical protein